MQSIPKKLRRLRATTLSDRVPKKNFSTSFGFQSVQVFTFINQTFIRATARWLFRSAPFPLRSIPRWLFGWSIWSAPAGAICVPTNCCWCCRYIVGIFQWSRCRSDGWPWNPNEFGQTSKREDRWNRVDHRPDSTRGCEQMAVIIFKLPLIIFWGEMSFWWMAGVSGS